MERTMADTKQKKNAKEKMKRKVEVVRWFRDVSGVGVTKGSVLVSRPTACVLYSCEYQLFRTDKSLLQKSGKKAPQNTMCLFIAPLSVSAPFHFGSKYFCLLKQKNKINKLNFKLFLILFICSFSYKKKPQTFTSSPKQGPTSLN